MEENNSKEDTQQQANLLQQEEIRKRREAVLLRQKELQQKSSQTPTPWEDTLKQQVKPTQESPVQQSTLQPQLSPQSFTNLKPESFRDSVQPTFREENVKNAVEFLTDSRVMASTKEKKSGFLRSKGLTQPEIDEAFRRADLQQPQQQQQFSPTQNNNNNNNLPVPSRPMVRYAQTPTQIVAQMPWKALAFLLVVCAGIGGAISWLIKKYILNPKTKALTETQDESIKNLQTKLDEVNAQLEKQSEEMKNTLNYIHSFLLNKKEYPRDNLDKTETLKHVIQEVTDTCNYNLYNPINRLPESPFIKNFPELKSDLVYAKQILSTATNTPLLEIPKKVPSKTLGLSSTSPMGNSLSTLGHNKSIIPSLSASTPANKTNPANSANKADINWLYNMPQNKRSQSEKSIHEKTTISDFSNTIKNSTSLPIINSSKDEGEGNEELIAGKQENVDFLKS